MYLTLEVVSPQAASLGASRRQVVGSKGLTIGRAPGNDWVIPDPYVSKQHARIVCTDGRFCLQPELSRHIILTARKSHKYVVEDMAYGLAPPSLLDRLAD